MHQYWLTLLDLFYGCQPPKTRWEEGLRVSLSILLQGPTGEAVPMTIDAFVDKMLPLLDMERDAEMEQSGESASTIGRPRQVMLHALEALCIHTS